MKLDLGCGDKPLEGYVGVDRKLGSEVYPLAYESESVDEVRASHVLEHFSHTKTLDVVKEWVRVLKPGGCLKIAVPDFDYITQAYASDLAGQLPLEGYLMGGHSDANDAHYAIFNDGKVRELFRLCGLRRVQRWKSEINDCAALPVSLNLAAYKPRREASLEDMSAVLSMPRLAFTDQATCLLESSRKLKFKTRIRQGVFWGQTMTAAIEQSLSEDSPKYILTVDYDTVFSPEDVLDLYDIMESRPDIDALCSMQMGRDRDTVLLTIRKDARSNKNEVLRDDFEVETTPINTGHFGLTILRADAFATLPKPWFIHTPDPTGGWGDYRVDEDINFWRGWERSGKTLHQANNVVVGHMQLMVTWPDRNLAPIHQYVGDYRREGKPDGVFA